MVAKKSEIRVGRDRKRNNRLKVAELSFPSRKANQRPVCALADVSRNFQLPRKREKPTCF